MFQLFFSRLFFFLTYFRPFFLFIALKFIPKILVVFLYNFQGLIIPPSSLYFYCSSIYVHFYLLNLLIHRTQLTFTNSVLSKLNIVILGHEIEVNLERVLQSNRFSMKLGVRTFTSDFGWCRCSFCIGSMVSHSTS